ncbi:MAG: RNA polymerase sigma factor [Eggerthellaceae bacterium]
MAWASRMRTMRWRARRSCGSRAGTKARWRNCIACTRPPCSHSSRRALGDRGAAEEAAVDVWLGCWRSAAAFRGDSRVLTWLLGIAKRQACMRMRRIRPEELPLDEDLTQLADEAGDPSDALMAQAGVGEIMAALDALPAALAETVRLAWLHELPYAEIAQVTDVPVGTVKSRVSRARALMQETLGGRL